MNFKNSILIFQLFLLSIFTIITGCNQKKQKGVISPSTPNIVIIYLDDLGFGDLSCYGGIGIKTPNIDALANSGVRFTNGYSTSATCTPSRYALLTGVYPWREKNAKILPGSAPLLIGETQLTIPKLMKSKGYSTALVGKWHLGLGLGNVDWNKHISPGPNEVGFDYSYILAATQDRVPTVYIENGNVVGLDSKDPIQVSYEENFPGEPTGLENPELTTMKWKHGHNGSIVNGIPRIGFMKGGEKAKWSDIDMADHFLAIANDFVKKHKDKPFFLLYTMQQPHVPRTPNPRFMGVSGMGPRGDVIVEADWCVGEFVKTLEEEGMLENTLIIFSSDNGPVVNDGYYDDSIEKLGEHKPAGNLRGGKYSLYDAGTRVPFITYWKGVIKPNVSDALVCQIDLLTSLSKLIGSDLKAPDSEDLLEVFLGKSNKGRNELILEATTRTCFRQGDWVLIPPYAEPKINHEVNIELGNDSIWQLFNIKNDVGQQINLAKTYPEMVIKMKYLFEEIRGFDYDEIEQLELK